MSVLSDRLNLIWYGDFEDHQNNPCTSFALADHTAIKRVYRTDDNVWPTYRKGASGNQFNTLECGYAYIVELEANQSVDIPHANISPNGSDARGLLVKEVELATPSPSPSPTPSPAPVGCIPSGYTEVSHSTSSQFIAGFGTVQMATTVGKFGFNATDFDSNEGSSRMYTVKFPDETLATFVTAEYWPSDASFNPMVYFETADGKCYGGELKPKPGQDSREVIMELISATNPTPSPTPSPTPVVATECGKPEDATYGSWDIAATLAEDVTLSGAHRDKDGNDLLIDIGDTDHLTSIGVPEEQWWSRNFMQFTIRGPLAIGSSPVDVSTGAELLYSRKQDPRPGANYNGERATLYGFFESQLPLPTTPAEFISACSFTLVKPIKGDDDIFLKIDGKCFKATYDDGVNSTDQTHFPDAVGNVIPGIQIIIFREVS